MNDIFPRSFIQNAYIPFKNVIKYKSVYSIVLASYLKVFISLTKPLQNVKSRVFVVNISCTVYRIIKEGDFLPKLVRYGNEYNLVYFFSTVGVIY